MDRILYELHRTSRACEAVTLSNIPFSRRLAAPSFISFHTLQLVVNQRERVPYLQTYRFAIVKYSISMSIGFCDVKMSSQHCHNKMVKYPL